MRKVVIKQFSNHGKVVEVFPSAIKHGDVICDYSGRPLRSDSSRASRRYRRSRQLGARRGSH